jgi:hypothetical protein
MFIPDRIPDPDLDFCFPSRITGVSFINLNLMVTMPR